MTPCAPGTILGVQFIIIYSIFPPFFVFLGEAGAEASDVSRVTPVWQGFCLPIMAAYVK